VIEKTWVIMLVVVMVMAIRNMVQVVLGFHGENKKSLKRMFTLKTIPSLKYLKKLSFGLLDL
jgi:hypothetical protein